MSASHERPGPGRIAGEIGLLLLAVLAVYGQVAGHGFVELDDGLYVSANAHVRQGLTWEGVSWAWRNFDAGNYHPLTWLSYMLDVSLFGIEPGWIAFENALLHFANAWLVRLLLLELGCTRNGALLGALVFAVHPLNVESVAWISQRKTVLAALFGLSALVVYLRRFRRGQSGVGMAVPGLFAASLLSKPWFVPLPLLFLAFDCLILGRCASAAGAGVPPRVGVFAGRVARLCVEKLGLGAVVLAAALLALLAQKSVGAVASVGSVPIGLRMENAVVSAGCYLATFFSPGGLSVFYPMPETYAWGVLAYSFVLVLGLCGAAGVLYRRAPEFGAGLLWFLLFLVPVIGLVQVGMQARADRYMYIPMIGLVWAAVRGAERLRERVAPVLRWVAIGGAVAWLLGCGAIAQRRASYWKNTYLLALHSITAVGPVPPLAAMLGATFLDMGEPEKALPLFEALAYGKNPPLRYVLAYARALHDVGRLREAIEVCRQVAVHDTDNYYAHAYLVLWYWEAGKAERAIPHLERLKTLAPPYGHVPLPGLSTSGESRE